MNSFFLFFLFFSFQAFSNENVIHNINYGQCPKQTSDLFLLEVLEEFNNNKSLLSLKKRIELKKLEKKFFLSHYQIDYSPIQNKLNINLKCPEPVAVINIYESLSSKKKYSQLLLKDGKLFNPTYEHALRSSNLLERKLPLVSIEEKFLDDKKQYDIAYVIDRLDKELNSKLIEVVVDNSKSVSLIFNFKSRNPASVFLGKGFWDKKIVKLNKIFEYYSRSKYVPLKINLENPDKVVIRF